MIKNRKNQRIWIKNQSKHKRNFIIKDKNKTKTSKRREKCWRKIPSKRGKRSKRRKDIGGLSVMVI